MAEANNQNEPNLEDVDQRNLTNPKEHTDKNQGNHKQAEKTVVYRNYGAMTVQPLVLRSHHWSTKDIKEKLSSTAQSSNVGQHNSGLSPGDNTYVADNLFKRQDSITNQNMAAPVGSTPGVCNVEPSEHSETNYSVRVQDITDDISEQSTCINSVTAEINVTSQCSEGDETEPLNIQSEISMQPNTKYTTDCTQPLLNQSREVDDKETDQGNANSTEETFVWECTNDNEQTIDDIEDENNATVNESVKDHCSLQAAEALSEERNNNIRVNVAVSVGEEEQTVRDRQLYDEVDERNEYRNMETNAERAENVNEDLDNDQNTANSQEVQENDQNEDNDEQNAEQKDTDEGKDQSENKDDESEAWTQEDIQALLRKAINLHASEKDLKTIINCGGNVNKPIKSGLYPLHYAAYTDYPQCIEILLNFGANVNVTDDIGYTPLHLAARRGNHKSLEALIENGAIINYCEPGVEIHQTDEKNKLGYTTMEPINLAIQNCHPKCTRLLLENGARPNNKYFMGYEICLAPLENPECLELLLEFGADPNVFNRCGLSPLMKACKDHHIEAVRKLLKYGADVNAICPPLFEQKSVLQFAISSGNIVIVNILLGKGAKLARQGEYRYSALHTAVMKGRADICRLLLQHGADPNEKAEEGATPLMLACATPDLIERRDIVQLLLDCGADINAFSPNYSYFDPYLAPLTEYFKCIGQKEGFGIVRLMIRNGAIINFCSSGLDMEMKRLRDPFSIVPYVHCLQDNKPMFDFVVSAAAKYSPLIIYATHNIPEDMKDALIYTATRPRNLKHLVRASLRSMLTPGLPEKVEKLPLPQLLKTYLLFR